MMEHKDCLGYNIMSERQGSFEKEIVNLKEWSNEKDVEIERQFQSLKESQNSMAAHYDKRMDNLEKEVKVVGKAQIEIKGELKGLNKNFTLLLRIIGGGVITGVIGLIFKIVWDIVQV